MLNEQLEKKPVFEKNTFDEQRKEKQLLFPEESRFFGSKVSNRAPLILGRNSGQWIAETTRN